MTVARPKPLWPSRFSRMESKVHGILFPQTNGDDLPQDAEWCEVFVDGQPPRRIRFHDYHELYKVPGLYEEIFYRKLKCCSPSRVAYLLDDILSDHEDDLRDLKVLDLGAGNGMLGDELRAREVNKIIGLDIIPEAKEATYRDRPDVYDDYLVADLTDLSWNQEEKLRRAECNCLTAVAALGFGDIPPEAFLKALDLIETPGWVAVTIKEDFFREQDTSGFSRLIRKLSREEYVQIRAYRRYSHRRSISGNPLYYVAMVLRKVRDVEDFRYAEEES